MKALILIGGFGTRLRPLSCPRPKALFPIINKPLLQWTYERLASDGIKEIILAVNRLTKFYIRQQHLRKFGLTVKYSCDPVKMPLGTAGPIKKAQKLLGNSPFLVINGDLITEISYSEMLRTHIESKAVATIALHEAQDPSRYGVVELTTSNRIKKFVEKPPKGMEPTKLINAGVYVFSQKIFDYIPSGRAVSMEREIFPFLAEENALFGHKVSGMWIDIGKPEEYLETNKMLLRTHADKQHKRRKFFCRNPVAIDKGVLVGEKSVIGPFTVLGRNVTIGRNVRIRDSVVFEDAKIDDYATIRGAIIGEAAKVGKKVELSEGCIVADHAKVKDGALLKKIRVCPAQEVT